MKRNREKMSCEICGEFSPLLETYKRGEKWWVCEECARSFGFKRVKDSYKPFKDKKNLKKLSKFTEQ